MTMLMRFDPMREFDKVFEQAMSQTRQVSMPMDAYRHGDSFVINLDLPTVPGDLITHGDLATEVGRPGAGQAVANVLRRAHDLPWWRVLPADGRLYLTHAFTTATARSRGPSHRWPPSRASELRSACALRQVAWAPPRPGGGSRLSVSVERCAPSWRGGGR